MRGMAHRVARLAVLTLVIGACGSSNSTSATSSVTSGTAPGSGQQTDLGAADRPTDRTCADRSGSAPLQSIASVPLTRIHDEDGITIDLAIYPHPDYEGNPWSQWGQGIVAPTGRYYSAIGDHLGADGNS